MSASESLGHDLSKPLAAAAAAYLETGLNLFHRKRSEAGHAQAAIGNLAAGIDLAIKALLAHADPALAFKDLPIEARAMLAAGPAAKGFNGRPYELDLRDFSFDTLSHEDAVRAFYVFFPERKQALRPYFKLLHELHTLSLQASLGTVKPHEPARMAYLALAVASLVSKWIEVYKLSDGDTAFVRRYETDRAARVEKRLEAALEKAKSLKVDITFNDPAPPDGWESFDARCPVCKNWAFVSGTTDIRCEKKGGEEEESLDFFADTFDCDACGLLLDDVEELKIAGLAIVYDRSEDLPKWREDKNA